MKFLKTGKPLQRLVLHLWGQQAFKLGGGPPAYERFYLRTVPLLPHQVAAQVQLVWTALQQRHQSSRHLAWMFLPPGTRGRRHYSWPVRATDKSLHLFPHIVPNSALSYSEVTFTDTRIYYRWVSYMRPKVGQTSHKMVR